jgi:hypothetical protein
MHPCELHCGLISAKYRNTTRRIAKLPQPGQEHTVVVSIDARLYENASPDAQVLANSSVVGHETVRRCVDPLLQVRIALRWPEDVQVAVTGVLW